MNKTNHDKPNYLNLHPTSHKKPYTYRTQTKKKMTLNKKRPFPAPCSLSTSRGFGVGFGVPKAPNLTGYDWST